MAVEQDEQDLGARAGNVNQLARPKAPNASVAEWALVWHFSVGFRRGVLGPPWVFDHR